ncbi:hypothetical protein N7E81_18190 [Reichenbachiella carrageenanivorans]|uniref:Outer membrane protein beta-barrel domain-containing protein n=1 Tax=Reichenbachiella carrageenanivorans TaxID=2979869 RepID=A0ABY6CZE0_9BACT|nr:hypothetical protein [Reichenbachiella carrageenanivorans]UXX79286.1 hypothetical protein N7E81_18190 [Reichenbachiella carrageenanivorans]
MKVNENQINGSESKAKATDELSKKAVEKIDGIPVKHFDLNETWLKLSNRLGHVDKRFVTWGLAMAASFSLLVAANTEIFNWGKLDTKPKETITHSPSVTKEKVVLPQKLPASTAVLEKITPLPVKEKRNKPVIKPPTTDTQQSIVKLDRNAQKHIEMPRLSNPFVSVFAKVNLQTEGITPELGIDFKLMENYTAKRREIYKLGASSQLNFRTNEAGDRKMHPHTFVNLEYSTLNKHTNKGWTTRAGYLLNPDGYLYQDTTIKVSLFRNIGKHLKIGPEVIFTDNLKQAYPSLSLVLG